MSPRYAVYVAPAPSTALAALGRQWLGRDAETGAELPPPTWINGAAAWWRSITDAPRRYGFHGTMKPPFVLAPGRDADELREALSRLAQSARAFSLPGLELTEIGSFVALVPTQSSDALTELADDCVTELDEFRAPPSESELVRRRASRLTERQSLLLQRWGYPYVLDEFRFHMTLTDGIADGAERGRAIQLLTAMFAAACREPMPVEDLCLFMQPRPDTPFVILERIPLRPASA
jgi:putative phosphonate metabolism protein